MSLFPSIFFVLLPLLYMESTSYVFPLRKVFFYLVITGWIFDISLCDNSINQSINKFILYVIPRPCSLVAYFCLWCNGIDPLITKLIRLSQRTVKVFSPSKNSGLFRVKRILWWHLLPDQVMHNQIGKPKIKSYCCAVIWGDFEARTQHPTLSSAVSVAGY